jgi:hypothetical protein
MRGVKDPNCDDLRVVLGDEQAEIEDQTMYQILDDPPVIRSRHEVVPRLGARNWLDD